MYKCISKKSNPLFSQLTSSINTTNTVYNANEYILYTKKKYHSLLATKSLG